ncbi:MAG: SLATT domain-containing protein [Bacteroidetes bacterium]|nr:SLATT domain-containing protein [Bacteroidota bacterium]
MEDILETAFGYWDSYSKVGRAHYIAWEKAAVKNRWLGIPVVITTAIVGTAIFGTLQESPHIAWKIAAGLLSLLAAVLSALQTSLKYSELSEKHKTAGAKYAAMRRRLDVFILKYRDESNVDRQNALKEFEEIATQFGVLAEESPSIPDKVYDQAAREFQMEDKNPVVS